MSYYMRLIEIIPGIAIYDTMQFLQPDVEIICMGLAASMGSFILVGGEITKCLAFPYAWRHISRYLGPYSPLWASIESRNRG
ncbi:hypothetical protein ACOSQ3_031861 [Xanthoceras sorbifolium]